jgi:CubicO group peptidase (beta-lactamase class C family)
MVRSDRTCWSAVLMFAVICVTSAYGGASDDTSDYWPTEAWRSSLPEHQGMDSKMLTEMLEVVREDGHEIRGIFVVRNGYLVLEAYFPPFRQDTWHILQSCTKSITSSLVGIAIDKGYIDSVNVPVLNLYPDITPDLLGENKRAMTLAHLLMMGSGLKTEDSYLYRWHGLIRMTSSRDWVRYVLDLPMQAAPGE